MFEFLHCVQQPHEVILIFRIPSCVARNTCSISSIVKLNLLMNVLLYFSLLSYNESFCLGSGYFAGPGKIAPRGYFAGPGKIRQNSL